jgi:hypothetical protein
VETNAQDENRDRSKMVKAEKIMWQSGKVNDVNEIVEKKTAQREEKTRKKLEVIKRFESLRDDNQETTKVMEDVLNKTAGNCMTKRRSAKKAETKKRVCAE